MKHLLSIFQCSLFISLVTASLSMSISVSASETDLLEQKEGFQGKVMGARVESVSIDEKDKVKQVTVSIPKESGPIEEVIVTAPRLDKPKREKPIFQMKPYKFIKDYEGDRYGLIIYLGEDNELPFRLYFSGEPE